MVNRSFLSRRYIAKLEEGFVLGGHNAFAIARVAKRARILIFPNSDFQKIINKNIAKKGLMKPITISKKVLKTLLNTYGKDASIIVMPYTASRHPYLNEKQRNLIFLYSVPTENVKASAM